MDIDSKEKTINKETTEGPSPKGAPVESAAVKQEELDVSESKQEAVKKEPQRKPVRYFTLRIVHQKRQLILSFLSRHQEEFGNEFHFFPTYPGYIFISEPSRTEYFVKIKQVTGVIGFIKNQNGVLIRTRLDIERLKVERKRKQVYKIGEKVFIKRGTFVDNYGTIEEVLSETKIKVGITFFGRTVPVEVSASDLKK